MIVHALTPVTAYFGASSETITTGVLTGFSLPSAFKPYVAFADGDKYIVRVGSDDEGHVFTTSIGAVDQIVATVTSVVPAATGVTTPILSTVATAVSVEVHVP